MLKSTPSLTTPVITLPKQVTAQQQSATAQLLANHPGWLLKPSPVVQLLQTNLTTNPYPNSHQQITRFKK